ncbi:MAG: acylphosphatase [Candidatus Omnitrophica bacterium]|nr:acylphosphatase [Candidatus Omnitrophota bacterium]
MKQAHILYSGMVQGVGFRFTAERFASRINLTGWVRNLSNGQVEILVEGSEEDIEQFCRDVEGHFTGYIHNKNIQLSPAEGKYKNFSITPSNSYE